jgi:hypothetical protein
MYKNKEKLFLFETKKGVIPRPKFSIFSFQFSITHISLLDNSSRYNAVICLYHNKINPALQIRNLNS